MCPCWLLRAALRATLAVTVTRPAVAQIQACWAADSEPPTCCLTCFNWVHGVTGIVQHSGLMQSLWEVW